MLLIAGTALGFMLVIAWAIWFYGGSLWLMFWPTADSRKARAYRKWKAERHKS